jgi:hypothetical protein
MNPRSSWWWLAASLVMCTDACADPRLVTRGYNVSSELSDYSPAVRLAVALPMLAQARIATRSRS